MTLFSEDIYSRKWERLMTTVPNFKPRGVGFRFAEPQIFIAVTATPTEILSATVQQIRCPPFRKRFYEYIERPANKSQVEISKNVPEEKGYTNPSHSASLF